QLIICTTSNLRAREIPFIRATPYRVSPPARDKSITLRHDQLAFFFEDFLEPDFLDADVLVDDFFEADFCVPELLDPVFFGLLFLAPDDVRDRSTDLRRASIRSMTSPPVSSSSVSSSEKVSSRSRVSPASILASMSFCNSTW